MPAEKATPFDERQRRRALNEAAFRSVNERLRGLNETFSGLSGKFSIVCECDDAACLEQIRLDRDAYEALRADPRLFAVVPGHDSPSVETLAEDRGAYHVVRKRPGDPEQVAIATDPRSN